MRDHPKLLGNDFARRWDRRGPADGPDRPRVLIEEPDIAEAFGCWCLLADNGYEVSWCPGPVGPPTRVCPLVATGHCGLVQHADVVVSSLGLHREASRMVVAALRRRHPETPLVVQAPQQSLVVQQAPRFEESWGAVPMPVSCRTLLDSVALALAGPVGAPHGDRTVGC